MLIKHDTNRFRQGLEDSFEASFLYWGVVSGEARETFPALFQYQEMRMGHDLISK